MAITALPGRLAGLDEALRAAGLRPLRVPLWTLAPRGDPATAAAARGLLALPWRIYPSRGAVEAWAALGLGYGPGTRLAALGEATAAALRAAGAVAAGAELAVVGRPARASGLLDRLLAHPSAPRPGGPPVGLVQGGRARPELREGLAAAGLALRVAEVYDLLPRPWTVAGPLAAVVLASPSAAAALPAKVGAEALLVALGPTTAAAVRRRGWSVRCAAEPTAAAVAAELMRGLRAPPDAPVTTPAPWKEAP